MATGLHRIAALIPGLEFRAHADWGSNNPKARGLIRESLAQVLSQIGNGLAAEEKNQIFILKGRPVLKSWAVSISHSLTYGAWAAVPFSQTDQTSVANTGLGLDIEAETRITSSVIKRVCTPAEIEAAPHLTYLWAAKEAAYKALPADRQPQAISGIQVTEWSEISPEVYDFKSSFSGTGFFTKSDGLHYALFKT